MPAMFPSQGTDSVNHGAEPHWRILVFNFAITFAAGLACGLVPALQATRQILALKPSSSVWLRKALVVRQLSLSLLLLIGAGLFPQSLSNLATFMIDPGLERVQERTGGSVLSGTVSTVEGDVRSGIRAVGSGASAPRWGAGFEDWGKKVLSNEKMAQLYFSGRDAVSGHIGWGGDPGTKTDIEIIGVVSDTKYEGCSKKAACPIRRVRWDLVAARAAVG